MRRFILLTFITCWVSISVAQETPWAPVEGKITTAWAEQVNPASPLPEHPRPQMIRERWVNLNGLWDYAIVAKETTDAATYQGKILVPFAVESALSGVGKMVGKENAVVYRRTVTLPSNFKNQKVLLHFGAVDWKCDVSVNGQAVGTHTGGYDPFSFDITSALKRSGTQEIRVIVWDPTDEGPQPRGKQVKNPKSIWYTPVTGIWQTVWLEAGPTTDIRNIRLTPNLDQSSIALAADVEAMEPGDHLRMSVWDGTLKVAEQDAEQANLTITVPNAKTWSPASPFLYDLRITLVRKGKTIDEVRSYFGMRKIAMAADANGVQRMWLNNEMLFQYGPLDQGWWPDGLYTAPTDEALLFDVRKTKDLGFNMIRKHVKVEPARWYYHCDRLGMLVWQDMPSGDMGNRWDSRPGIIGVATEKQRTGESEKIFRDEWKAIMDANMNAPSIVVWVPFNEAWGQFKTQEITEWTMSYDPTRLVNAASGGNFYGVGHIMDLHNYPEPAMPAAELFGKDQIIVLGEYGGLGLPIEGHTWQDKNNWGYQSFTTPKELLDKYEEFIYRLAPLIEKGLSAAIYTQTTDVEIETNGLMTYDRKVIKMDEERLNRIHQRLYDKALLE
ncbi:MAG TPA: glycoside hydrolase family 2 TIM barrel-domain containing protein [Chryseosolibacter sp.]|nr:glycoside hydrolase family 2 TIM barrel-domain containing protein [Chryseosolibacter sp.]